MTARLLERKAPMLQWLAQFLTAPIINGFLDAYKAKLAAANAQGAQAVEVARSALLAEIEARKSANAVILAEQGRWYRDHPPAPGCARRHLSVEGDRVGHRARPRHHRSDRRRRRRVGGLDRDRLCRRPLAREDRAHDLEAAMTARRPQSERLAVLEQQVSHMEAELERMSAKVDEMHAILLQARGVRWAIIVLAGLVGFLAGLSHWVIARV